MLLPLQENPLLSVSRKTLITPFGSALLPGHTQGGRRSHLMVCVTWYAVFCLFCVILSLLGWKLRNMSAETKAINVWWSNQIKSFFIYWNPSFRNHNNLKAMFWAQNKLFLIITVNTTHCMIFAEWNAILVFYYFRVLIPKVVPVLLKHVTYSHKMMIHFKEYLLLQQFVEKSWIIP